MTRSTASASCSEIWSSDSAGTERSPRRASASSACAFSIARSPPFTATYMSVAPVEDAHRARDGSDGVAARQQKVDAARKQPAIGGKPIGKIRRQRRRTEGLHRRDAGTGQRQPVAVEGID